MERHRRKALKKKRRDAESRVKSLKKIQAEAKKARVENQSTTQFSRSAWQALKPPDNMVQQESPKPVLNENQGFQTSKWKPHEENSD